MSRFESYPAVASHVAEEFAALGPRLTRLLYNRGITTRIEAEQWLAPSYDTQLHDPFLLHDMEVAVNRVLAAILNNELIVIYSDYDCDGIPGAVVLHDFFKAIGFLNFHIHIPHRHYDGFGLSAGAVEHLFEKVSPQLIITIDCGTTDITAVARANELGVDVIITDHHEPKEVLPSAVAVVNPKIGTTYPFTGLCGAAVVFKLVQALITRGSYAISPGQEKWWLDMVGIATIADMVPLRDENRVLAHYGLTVLRKSRRPGIQQLLRKQRVEQRHLTEDDIGFTIGPRINAASRMDTPEDAFHLLASTDEVDARARVDHLEHLNQARKSTVALMTKELHKRLELVIEQPPIIVMGNPEWRPSLVGLAANKLAEEHNRPVFLWGRDGNEHYKGSCRAGGGKSVVKIMEAAPHLFKEFGGHHASGGFTVAPEYIHTFGDALIETVHLLGDSVALVEPLLVDEVLSLSEVGAELFTAQQRCAPFGCDNPKPLYHITGVVPKSVEVFGKNKEHTKLILPSTFVKEAIAFFKSPSDFMVTPEAGKSVGLLAELEESYFMNRRQIRLRIVDIVI